jgi:hypothetical protein
MTRYKAATIHFLGSLLVLLSVFSFVRLVWYPGPLFDAASGVDLIGIVTAVDLILGPMITLLIFNPKKKSLKFDMACVLICQLGFMVYGAWSIFSARPVYLVFVDNRFQLVTANEIDPADQAKAKNAAFRTQPLAGPITLASKLPDDKKLGEQMMFVRAYGMGPENLPEYFVPYKEAIPAVQASGMKAEKISGVSSEMRQRLSAYEAKQQKQNVDVVFVPLINKKKSLYVAVDKTTGATMDIL